MATVTIKGITRLSKRLQHISQMENVKEAVNDATLLVHAQAKALAPVNNGTLAGSIHADVKVRTNEIVGKVYTNLNYAPYVEFGTGIKGKGTYPNKDISLAYRPTPWTYTPDGGETFYRTEGQVAQPYMYPALKRNQAKIKRWIREAVKTDVEKG